MTQLSKSNSDALIRWDPSPAELTVAGEPADDFLGYHVYRRQSVGEKFERRTMTPVLSNSYVDEGGFGFEYMIRAVKMETSGSGSYTNFSQGAFSTPPGAPAPGFGSVAVLAELPTRKSTQDDPIIERATSVVAMVSSSTPVLQKYVYEELSDDDDTARTRRRDAWEATLEAVFASTDW